jgi:predicted amidohydrolase
MIIGYAQFEPRIGHAAENRAAIERLVEANSHADLLVFPELATSGYDFRDAAEAARDAEPFAKGETAALLMKLTASHRMTIVTGYPEWTEDGLYNSCMLALPDGTFRNYRKIHLFSREKLFFRPGDAPPPVIETPAGRVGLMICFDWIFPETARLLALNGAQIIAHPSNLILQFCQRAMYARAVENRVFIVTANRIGTETNAGRTLRFTGASQILDPSGAYLCQAPEDGEHAGLAEIEPAAADSKRVTDHNDLFADRRIDLYGGLH